MKKDKLREMTFLGLNIAIIIIMSVVPFLGYIPFGSISITIVHIPVLICAYRYKIFGGFICGLSFGISSFLVGVLRPSTLMDTFFVNPLVSLVPRILFGIFAGFLFQLKFDNGIGNFIKSLIATLFHTFAVMSLLYLCYLDQVLALYPNIAYLSFIGLFLINGLLEGVVGGFLVNAIIALMKKTRYQ